MQKIFFLLIAGGPLVVNPRPALAGNIVVGVNTLGAANMNDEQQDALIEQLQKNGVKTVGTGIGGRFNRFITNAHQHGIGAVVAVWPVAKPTSPPRPADPSLGLFWAQHRLSDADPGAFRASVTALLTPIEAAGIPLTALELGNEINGPFYNGDFLPTQATGRILGLSDLDNPNDPEGQAIAIRVPASMIQA